MNYEEFKAELDSLNISYKENFILAPLTTWKVGGPAKIFIELNDIEKAKSTIRLSYKTNLPVFVMGGGSNILISDEGFDGIVLKNQLTGIEITKDTAKNNTQEKFEENAKARLIQVDKKNYYSFDEFNYDESEYDRVLVKVYSATLLSFTINNLIQNGITGLQWFAGIPGTIGGAIYNNIHGGTHFFSEYIEEVDLINHKGEIETIKSYELGLDYDFSKIQSSKNFILSVKLKLFKGDKQRAQKTAVEWSQVKRLKQPYNSAGCCFKNITNEELSKTDFLSSGWGYIIEHKLGLKGFTHNGAQISTKHAAFIENIGNAKAEDIMYLLELIYKTAKEKINITPKTEIFFVGFPKDRIEKFQ